MAEKQTQNPKNGEITKEGSVGPTEHALNSVEGKTTEADSKEEFPKNEIIQPLIPKIIEKMFDMIVGVLSLKVQSIRVHQALTVNGEAKAAIDIDKNKCKMMLCPFGVMLISKHYSGSGESKRLITFNNCYEIEFVK